LIFGTIPGFFTRVRCAEGGGGWPVALRESIQAPPPGRPGGSGAPSVALSKRLDAAARVTVLSAPPGSGKTVLLRSWISLTEFWAGQLDGQRHLEQGATLARTMKRPYPEFIALAYQAEIELFGSFARG